MKPHWLLPAALLLGRLPCARPLGVPIAPRPAFGAPRRPFGGGLWGVAPAAGGAEFSDLAGARLAGIAGVEGAPSQMLTPAHKAEMWAAVSSARRWEPRLLAVDGEQWAARLAEVFSAPERTNWYFFGIILAVLISMDVTVLQHLPETARAHVVLLLFWVLVSVAVCLEVWLRLGPQAGTHWLAGYILELEFSAENVFVLHAIFCAFETPRRLTCRAMFLWLLGSMLVRLAFFLGVASALAQLRLVPYLVGLWLLYTGARHVFVHDDDGADVTQATLVRAASRVLGDRLGKFYDEEGEAMLAVCKGKTCVTLLSLVVLSLLTADLFLSVDVVLTKAEKLPNTHLNFGSSALALFTVRALFFVARDCFNRCGDADCAAGIALMLMGVQALVSQVLSVSAAMSLAGVALVAMASMLLPVFRWVHAESKVLL